MGIPTRKKVYVTINLVIDLLESEGFMAMVVFVDKLTKMAHLSPWKKEVSTMEYAKIFIDNVFQHHSLLEVIISDQDPCFIRKF